MFSVPSNTADKKTKHVCLKHSLDTSNQQHLREIAELSTHHSSVILGEVIVVHSVPGSMSVHLQPSLVWTQAISQSNLACVPQDESVTHDDDDNDDDNDKNNENSEQP